MPELGVQIKSGLKYGILPYKKSKSHDEASFASTDVSSDPDKKKFRRSFSQGNIFEKISGMNRFSTAINSLNNNHISQDDNNLAKLVPKDISISPCFKIDGLSVSDKSSSKASSEADTLERSDKSKAIEDNLINKEKSGNKQGSIGSSENSKSPLSVDVPMTEKDIVKPMPICNDLVFSYPASTSDGGEMKRFLFNDFVAQAAVANAARNNIVEIGRQTHQRQMLLAAAAHAAAANAAAVHSFTTGPTHDAMKFRKLEEKEHMPNTLYPKILDHAARDIPPMPQLPENIIVSGVPVSGALPQNSVSGPGTVQPQLPGHGTSAGFCNICHKFVSNRTNHKYVHSQVKFRCKLCGYLYSRKDTLKDHIRGKHCANYSNSDLNNLVEVVPSVSSQQTPSINSTTTMLPNASTGSVSTAQRAVVAAAAVAVAAAQANIKKE